MQRPSPSDVSGGKNDSEALKLIRVLAVRPLQSWPQGPLQARRRRCHCDWQVSLARVTRSGSRLRFTGSLYLARATGPGVASRDSDAATGLPLSLGKPKLLLYESGLC